MLRVSGKAQGKRNCDFMNTQHHLTAYMIKPHLKCVIHFWLSLTEDLKVYPLGSLSLNFALLEPCDIKHIHIWELLSFIVISLK